MHQPSIDQMKHLDQVAPKNDKDAQHDHKLVIDDMNWVPQDVKHLAHSADHGMARIRKASIMATPAFIVNNSSNILGAAHVGTEMLMFKSGMGDGEKLIKNPGNIVNWVKEPIETVFSQTFRKAQAHDLTELFKGNVFKNFYERVTNKEDARVRFLKRPENMGVANVKLLSSWQFRSTFAGLVAWTLSTFIPEKKESDDEVERMALKRRLHPVAYVGERLKQAVWVPEWHKHKREMLGLAYMVIGVSSIIGAWRGRSKDAAGIERYVLNKGYLFTSVISLVSSIPLLFASDEQSAYGAFGALMMLRIPFLGFSISDKYKNKPDRQPDPGRHNYAASSVSFQFENLAQALIGGAQKVSDGHGGYTIIDHTAIREEAKEKATEVRLELKEEKLEHVVHELKQEEKRFAAKPHTHVSAISKPERAMPDRVKTHESEQVPGAIS